MACQARMLPLLTAVLAAMGTAGCERPAEAGGVGAPGSPATSRPAAESAGIAAGGLASRPDSELFALLPVQEDFPSDAFLAPSPADPGGPQKPGERKLPETDPPGCASGNPAAFRANAITAVLSSDEEGKRTVSLAIGRQTADQGAVSQVKDWAARCARFTTPPSFGGVEGEETVTLSPQEAPELGLDDLVAFEQRTEGSVRIAGADQESTVDERIVTVFGQLRGVFVDASWRDDQDRDLAVQLLAQLVDRVRAA